MAKIPKNEQGQEFHLRKGSPPFGGSGWSGVNSQDNPAALNPNEPQRADNWRIQGGDYISRPGHSSIFDFSTLGLASYHPNGAAGIPSDNPRVRLWMTTLGCYGASIATGATIIHFDTTENPSFTTFATYGTTNDFQAPIGRYGDKFYFGDREVLREITPISFPPTITPAPNPPSIPVAQFPGFIIRCLLEFDSKLFIGLENVATPASSKIVVFNGKSFQDDITGVRPPINFGLYTDKIVAGFDATAAHIRVRPIGAVGIAWVTVSLAGFQCGIWGNAMAELRGKLWIVGGNDKLFSYDGTSLVLERTIAGCDTGTKGCTAVAVHRGILYYGWNTASPNFLPRLGRHDPDSSATSFTDTYKDVNADIANFKELTSLVSFRSQAYLGGRSTYLAATKINDVKGTLESISAPAVVAGFHISQLLRFP